VETLNPGLQGAPLMISVPHKTLFYEIAHVLLWHHEDTKTPRAVKEADAEAVALLCLEALDLPGAD